MWEIYIDQFDKVHKSFHLDMKWVTNHVQNLQVRSHEKDFFFNLLHSFEHMYGNIHDCGGGGGGDDNSNNFAREVHLNHEITKWFIAKMQYNKDVIILICSYVP